MRCVFDESHINCLSFGLYRQVSSVELHYYITHHIDYICMCVCVTVALKRRVECFVLYVSTVASHIYNARDRGYRGARLTCFSRLELEELYE